MDLIRLGMLRRMINLLREVGRKVKGINILGKSTAKTIFKSRKMRKFRTFFHGKTRILLRDRLRKGFYLRQSNKF